MLNQRNWRPFSAQQTAKRIKRGRRKFPPPRVAWLKSSRKCGRPAPAITRNSTLATSSSTAYRLLRSPGTETELEGNYAVWNCLNSAWRTKRPCPGLAPGTGSGRIGSTSARKLVGAIKTVSPFLMKRVSAPSSDQSSHSMTRHCPHARSIRSRIASRGLWSQWRANGLFAAN
jgi:hypothetical protein